LKKHLNESNTDCEYFKYSAQFEKEPAVIERDRDSVYFFIIVYARSKGYIK